MAKGLPILPIKDSYCLFFILKIEEIIDHKNNKKASGLKICYQKKYFLYFLSFKN